MLHGWYNTSSAFILLLQVLAVDNSMDALDMAQRRLDAAGGQVPMNLQLRWADTVHLSRTLGRRHFDTLLDCAMLHCLRSRQQKTYLDSLTTQVCTLRRSSARRQACSAAATHAQCLQACHVPDAAS